MIDYVDRHWNTACEGTLPQDLPGDRALVSIIGVDSIIQNGGVVHALEVFGPEIREAIRSFRWFGLTEYADILESAAADTPLVDEIDRERRRLLYEGFSEERNDELDRRWYALDPESDRLLKTFAARIEREPSAFVRLGGSVES